MEQISSEIITIRHASQIDLPALEWEGELTHFRNIFAEAYRLMELGEGLIWVVDHLEKGLIGQLFVHLYPVQNRFSNQKPQAYIYGFRIRTSFRQQGIGTRLMRQAESDLEQRGYQLITLNVGRNNPRARKLYERLGFRVVSAEPGVWSYIDENGVRREVNEPAWRMEKEI
jgi:ribosomal protein S18 acetylase RimI-like enzyme